MKKIFIHFILFSVSSGLLHAASNGSATHCGGNSFFRTRSVIEQVNFFLALNEYAYFMNQDSLYQETDTSLNYIAAGLFYEQSHKNNIAPYFLPNNNCTVAIREDGSGDISSLWLKVIAAGADAFSSDLSLCPTRRAWGAYFNYHRNFCSHPGWWLDIKAAAYQANHALNPCEVLTDPSVVGTLPGIANALDYLSSAQLQYGRIARGCLKRGGFDDIEFKIGYDTFCDNYYAGIFGSVLLPTAPKPKARYLFEPLIGRGHFGLGVGFNGGTNLYTCDNHSLALMTELSYQYLFKRKELRSFDLVNNGAWSRYLRVAREEEPAVSYPAINFTTLCADVTMRSVVNWWTALHSTYCSWHGEIGYNLWWRQQEKICLDNGARNCFDNANIGIFGMGNVCTPTSASTANISQGKTFTGTGNVVVNDPAFIALTSNDLDLCAAAMPSTLTNTVYAALARDFTLYCHETNFGIGASYEFARCFNALQQWAVWANFNINF